MRPFGKKAGSSGAGNEPPIVATFIVARVTKQQSTAVQAHSAGAFHASISGHGLNEARSGRRDDVFSGQITHLPRADVGLVGVSQFLYVPKGR